MKNKILSFAHQAQTHYSNEGLSSLIKSGLLKLPDDLVRRRSLSRREMKKIATDHECIWHLDREEQITITPLDDNVLNNAFKPYRKNYQPKRPFICEFEDCCIIGSGAVGLTNDGRLIQETVPGQIPDSRSLGSQRYRFYMRGVGLNKKQPEISLDGVFFPLISEYHSYYHWMVEYLPKLRLLEHYKQETERDPTILIESNPRSFIQQTLHAAGYEADQYREWNETECQVDNLIVPIHRTHRFNYQNPKYSNYNPSRADLLWLKNQIQSNIDLGESTNNKLIYVSRQEVPPERGRRVVNYDSIISIVEEYGGDEYVLENLDFEDQVRLFSDSDIIISPHGAGLTNMIFANNPTVIELFPQSVLKPHFYFMSKMLGYEYEPLVTKNRGQNLVIDVDRFRNHIEEVIKSR